MWVVLVRVVSADAFRIHEEGCFTNRNWSYCCRHWSQKWIGGISWYSEFILCSLIYILMWINWRISKYEMLQPGGLSSSRLVIKDIHFEVWCILTYCFLDKNLLQYVGVDPLQAGNVVQLVLVLGLTVGWISTYIFRVSNKEMTYAQQLRDYEDKVMQVNSCY